MVVDTMSAVKSKRLLKVLLDSGSTTTLINRKCLSQNCKTCKTSQSSMVNTLAGSYKTSVMVVMHNLRLPELDKNHKKYAQRWLAWYPWPQQCIHDPGGEFTGIEFQKLLEKCHIPDACTSANNPQSNAICKRMH